MTRFRRSENALVLASTRRAGFTVLVGSASGFGLALLLTPVVSRLYSPSVFGTFATITALASIFVGVSTFRLEVFAQRVTDDSDAERLQRVGLVTAVSWGFAVTLTTGVVVLVTGASAWLLAAGPLVTVASLQLVGSARLVREQRYTEIAVKNFAQGAGTAVLQVVLGALVGTAGSLLTGFAAARLAWVPGIWGRRRRESGRRSPGRLPESLRKEARRFGLISGSAAAVNSVGGQLPLLTCSIIYGQAEVGFLAMALRLIVAPMSVIGQAAAAAGIGEVGRRLREHDAAAMTIVHRGMRQLLALGAIPCTAAAVAGPWLTPVLLGPDWAPAGPVVAWLALGTLAQFAVAPFSQVVNLTGRHGWMLGWDSLRLLVVGAATAVPAAVFHQPLEVTVAVYSVSSVVLYVLLGGLCLRAVRSPR